MTIPLTVAHLRSEAFRADLAGIRAEPAPAAPSHPNGALLSSLPDGILERFALSPPPLPRDGAARDTNDGLEGKGTAIADRVGAAYLTGGTVDWDTIAFLKAEMGKRDPDEQAIIDALRRLAPNDRLATLQALGRRGTPSELGLLIDRIATSPSAMRSLGSLMADVAFASRFDPGNLAVLQDMLESVAGESNGGVATREFMNGVKGSGILASLGQASIDALYKSFGDRTIGNAYYTWLVADEGGGRQPSWIPANVIWGVGHPGDQTIDEFIAGKDDPGLVQALVAMPERAGELILRLLEDGKLDAFLGRLELSGQDLSPLVARLIDKGSDEPLTAVLRYLLRCERTPDAGGRSNLELRLSSASLSARADDIVREAIAALGGDAKSVLSKLSPFALLDMIDILQAGDDVQANRQVIADILRPAYDAARAR